MVYNEAAKRAIYKYRESHSDECRAANRHASTRYRQKEGFKEHAREMRRKRHEKMRAFQMLPFYPYPDEK